MGAPMITTAATIMCPHGASATINSANVRVKAGGSPIALLSDITTVAGCPFTVPGPKPQPCILVQWLVGATRVKVGGTPVLLQNSTGLAKSAEQIPQGPPNVVQTQVRVTGT
jgi:uncharacterized Zn-binding protein involved in type VI secretion